MSTVYWVFGIDLIGFWFIIWQVLIMETAGHGKLGSSQRETWGLEFSMSEIYFESWSPPFGGGFLIDVKIELGNNSCVYVHKLSD